MMILDEAAKMIDKMKGEVWYLLATRPLLSEAADSTSLQAVDA